MNKSEIISAIAKETGSSKADAEKHFNAFQKVLMHTLKEGGEIALTGFVSVKVVERPASEGRNPRTGDPIQIPAKRIVKFKAGKQLADIVN